MNEFLLIAIVVCLGVLFLLLFVAIQTIFEEKRKKAMNMTIEMIEAVLEKSKQMHNNLNVLIDSYGQLEVLEKENAKLNDATVEFIESNMFSSLDGYKFDMIISNPPYIKRSDILTLQNEVKSFEPTLAIDGGEDGFDFYKIIAKNAKNFLNDGGLLLLECGIGQADIVKDMLNGFSNVEIIKDYENIDRIIKAVF